MPCYRYAGMPSAEGMLVYIRAHWTELELELDFSGGGVSVRKVKVDTDSIPGSSTIPESVSDPDEVWPGILYDVNLRKLHLTNMVLSIVNDLDEKMQDVGHGGFTSDHPLYPDDEDLPD